MVAGSAAISGKSDLAAIGILSIFSLVLFALGAFSGWVSPARANAGISWSQAMTFTGVLGIMVTGVLSRQGMRIRALEAQIIQMTRPQDS
jgi:hypothetical protein